MIKELRANFCQVPEIEGIEEAQDAPELTASLIKEELDHEKSNLIWQERSLMEAMRLDPPNPCAFGLCGLSQTISFAWW